MRLHFNAGSFTIETYTDGYPMWIKLKYGDLELIEFRHDEIKDLIYVLERMKNNAQGKMPANYRSEFD